MQMYIFKYSMQIHKYKYSMQMHKNKYKQKTKQKLAFQQKLQPRQAASPAILNANTKIKILNTNRQL